MQVRTRWILVGSLLLGALVAGPVLANGITGSDAPSRIPSPSKVFTASFEDVGGTTVDARRVTFNGEVFVYGKYGEGQVTVPFEKIREVRIEKAQDPLKRIAVIALIEGGEPVRVTLEDDTPWYGLTRFGNYKVEVRDLRVAMGFALVPKED